MSEPLSDPQDADLEPIDEDAEQENEDEELAYQRQLDYQEYLWSVR